MSAYIGCSKNLKDLKDRFLLIADWRAGSSRSETALFCGSFLRKGEVFAYLGRNQNLKDLKRAGSSRSSAAIRKEAGLFCGSFLRKGEVLAYFWTRPDL